MEYPLLPTITFFAANNRLASKEELYHYQVQTSIPLSEIHNQACSIPGVIFRDGVYGFEENFSKLWQRRQEVIRESSKRYRKARRWGRVLTSIPFIRGVFLAGSLTLSTGNAKKTSDIDVFIVTKAQRIWLARFLLTVVTHIFRIRRRGEYDVNLFCLNHYVTEDNLYRDDHDLYAAHLYGSFIAVGKESQQTLEEFWRENSWIQEFFSQLPKRKVPFLQVNSFTGKSFVEMLLEGTGLARLSNYLLGHWQRRKILANPLSQAVQARIKAKDDELEFHPVPNTYRLQREMDRVYASVSKSS